jgi:hypothetical protein
MLTSSMLTSSSSSKPSLTHLTSCHLPRIPIVAIHTILKGRVVELHIVTLHCRPLPQERGPLKYEFDLVSLAGIICAGVGITLISFGGIGVCCSAWANGTLSALGSLLGTLGGILLRPLLDYYVLEPLGISKWLG